MNTPLTVAGAALALALSACASTPGESEATGATAEMPNTEIYLASLTQQDGAWRLGELRNVSNNPHYDNQPSFLPDGNAFLYASADENGKTDIWRYRIDVATKERLFSSPAKSEYSPKLAPGGAAISYIQEDEAGDVTRVHRRNADGVGEGEPVADFAPLGYYAWLDGGAALGVYYRSEPGSLYRVEVESGETTLLHDDIGRALEADPAGAHLWFVSPVAAPADDVEAGAPETAFRLMRYDSDGGDIAALFDLPPGGQDFALALNDDGEATGVFATDGTTILFRDFNDDGWTRLPEPLGGLRNATRIAVSPDRRRIAVVQEAE